MSNRADWLKDPAHWQGKTREIEDRLSDALHEQLTQRFVDRRTSALMKGMRDKDELHAEIAADGAINVENHFVGRLKGFRFQLDPGAEGIHGKATRNAAAQVLARELGMRARRVAAAQPDALSLDRRGRIMWRDEEIGADRGDRRSAEADRFAAGRRASVRARPREGAGAARSVAGRRRSPRS